jgi:hypothetical protein
MCPYSRSYMFLTFMQLVPVGNWHGHLVHPTRSIQGFVAPKTTKVVNAMLKSLFFKRWRCAQFKGLTIFKTCMQLVLVGNWHGPLVHLTTSVTTFVSLDSTKWACRYAMYWVLKEENVHIFKLFPSCRALANQTNMHIARPRSAPHYYKCFGFCFTKFHKVGMETCNVLGLQRRKCTQFRTVFKLFTFFPTKSTYPLQDHRVHLTTSIMAFVPPNSTTWARRYAIYWIFLKKCTYFQNTL